MITKSLIMKSPHWMVAFALGLATTLTLPLQAAPEKIVVLGGALTETVYALEGGAQVVAVDASSTWPEAARAKATLGYYRQVPAEGVVAQRPDLVLASDAAGPPTALEQIRGAGVKVEILPQAQTPRQTLDNIRAVGRILGKTAEGEALAQKVEADLAEIKKSIAAHASAKPKVVFLMSPPGSDRLMAGGSKTAAHAMIELAGGENVFSGMENFKPVSAEALASSGAEVILVPSPRPGLPAADPRQDPLLKDLPAVKSGRIHAVDLALVLGFGPRLPEGLRVMAGHMHPVSTHSVAHVAQP
jgi:iron complex transport system substrate-binding protein